MNDWNKVQRDMGHVSYFRDLNENDWEALCENIKSKILAQDEYEDPLKDGVTLIDKSISTHDRRGGERRAGDRRDIQKLDDVSQEDWDDLCHRIRALTLDVRDKDEREKGSDRRKGQRRK